MNYSNQVAERLDGVSQSLNVPNDYLQRFAPVVERQLLKAGVRLAIMLNGLQ